MARGRKEWWVKVRQGWKESRDGVVGRTAPHLDISYLRSKKIPRPLPRPVFTSQVQISFISRTDEDSSIWQLQIHGSRRPSLTDYDSLRFVLSLALSLPWRRRSWVVWPAEQFRAPLFFSSFLRVERARNCSLDSLAALAMDCGTVAQYVGVTPGPLCIAGMYACSVCLSWYRHSLLSFSLVLSFLLLKEKDGNRWKNLFALNSLLNECTIDVRFPAR